MQEQAPQARGKEKEKRKALMPLANRLGLDEGATSVAPPAPTPPVQMGNLVDTAMQQRRDSQNNNNPSLLEKKNPNKSTSFLNSATPQMR